MAHPAPDAHTLCCVFTCAADFIRIPSGFKYTSTTMTFEYADRHYSLSTVLSVYVNGFSDDRFDSVSKEQSAGHVKHLQDSAQHSVVDHRAVLGPVDKRLSTQRHGGQHVSSTSVYLTSCTSS